MTTIITVPKTIKTNPTIRFTHLGDNIISYPFHFTVHRLKLMRGFMMSSMGQPGSGGSHTSSNGSADW